MCMLFNDLILLPEHKFDQTELYPPYSATVLFPMIYSGPPVFHFRSSVVYVAPRKCAPLAQAEGYGNSFNSYISLGQNGKSTVATRPTHPL